MASPHVPKSQEIHTSASVYLVQLVLLDSKTKVCAVLRLHLKKNEPFFDYHLFAGIIKKVNQLYPSAHSITLVLSLGFLLMYDF